MKKMNYRGRKAFCIGIAWILCAPVLTMAQALDETARAQEVLNSARAALGGDEALRSVRSLSATGDFRSGPDAMAIPGTVQLGLLFPNHLMRTLKYSPVQTMKVTAVEAMNGDDIWTSSKTKESGPMQGISTPGIGGMGRGGGHMGGRRGGRSGGGGGARGGGENRRGLPAPNFRETPDNQQLKLDFSSLLFSLLLHGSDLSKYTVRYMGNIEVEETQADSLKISTEDGLEINLALDKKNHRPVMASYQVPTTNAVAGEGKQSEGSESGRPENQIFFSEYRLLHQKKIGDVWLPYQISKAHDGQTVEDMHIKKYQLNPKLKPKDFEKKS
jgi:hypothetical protein